MADQSWVTLSLQDRVLVCLGDEACFVVVTRAGGRRGELLPHCRASDGLDTVLDPRRTVCHTPQ